MANRLEELERAYTESKLEFYDHEQRYRRSSGILNDSCTTVSRIMYQLQNFQVKFSCVDWLNFFNRKIRMLRCPVRM
jgi:hypothetical protein